MSEMKQALTQIVSSLMEIISKSAPPTLQPSSAPLKKTADMTYAEYLARILAGKDPIAIPNKKDSFRLQEDLELLLALSQRSQINSQTFEDVANQKRINRSADSLRARYYDHLHKVTEKEMKKIVDWIETNNIEGYLRFEGNDLSIQLTDPRDDKRKIKSETKSDPRASDSQTKPRKSAKIHTSGQQARELNEILKIYSKMVNLPPKALVQILDQVSGDPIQLDNYIETKDPRLLWTPEEDDILRTGGPELDVLRRYRGSTIETRKKYLGIP